MALAPHHVNAIVREVWNSGYRGRDASDLVDRAIEFAADRVYSSVSTLVRDAASSFVERGYVSGRTESSLARRIGTKFGFDNEPGTDARPTKRPAVTGKPYSSKSLFRDMSYSGYIQRDDRKIQYSLGKRIPRNVRVLRDLAQHDQKVVERFQANQDNSPSDTANSLLGSKVLGMGPYAANPLPLQVVPTNINSQQFPFFAFDLTSVYNNNRNTTFTHPCVLYRCLWDITNSRIRFVPSSGRDLDDANSVYTWQVERMATDSSARDVVGDKTYISGAKFNFSFMGARNLPSTVYIELWRFDDEDIAPEVWCANQSELAGDEERIDDIDNNRRRAYWFARMKNQVGINNQLFGDTNVLDGAYVKRLRTLKFQPTSTTESDPNGHVRNLELYVDMGKTINYRWTDNSADVTVTEIGNPDETMQLTGQDVQRPYPEVRNSWYLVVRADVNQVHASDWSALSVEAKQNLFPSFDFICRRYRNQLKI